MDECITRDIRRTAAAQQVNNATRSWCPLGPRAAMGNAAAGTSATGEPNRPDPHCADIRDPRIGGIQYKCKRMGHLMGILYSCYRYAAVGVALRTVTTAVYDELGFGLRLASERIRMEVVKTDGGSGIATITQPARTSTSR